MWNGSEDGGQKTEDSDNAVRLESLEARMLLASRLGAAATLEGGDWLVPSFREMAAKIWRGKDLENVLSIYGGYNEGGRIADDVNNLPVLTMVIDAETGN